MANWCSNYVVIHGDNDKIKKVIDEIKRLKIKSEETSEKKSLNFIEQIVENDLKEGKNEAII